MSVKIATTRVNLSGGTGLLDITIPGIGTPKAAIFILSWATADNTASTNAKMSIGFTDGVRNRCADLTSNDNGGTSVCSRGFNNSVYHLRSGGGTLHQEGVFDAWIPDGIRINQTTGVTNCLATVVLIGGTEPQCYVGTLTNNASIGGTAAITDPGFTPHTIFFVSANTTSTHVADACLAWGCADRVGGVTTQRSAGIAELNGAATTSVAAYFSNAHACKVLSDAAAGVGIDITSFDANGFTATTRDVAASTSWGYLAVTWGTRQHALSTVFSPTATGASAQTWPGFKPQALIGGQQILGSQNTFTANQNAGGFAAAAVTPAAAYCTSINDQDNVSTTNSQTLSDDTAVHLPDETGTALLVASLTSMDATGYTLNYSTTGVSGRAGWWLAVQAEQDLLPKVQYYRAMMGVA
jgi:hypothetical protein